MRRFVLLIAIAAFAACSSLPDAGGGIVALEVFPPDSLFLFVGDSVQLRARAVDLQGDSVAAQVIWRTPDTAFVTLDTVTGVMVGRSVGSAHVQARVGTLISNDNLIFTIRADTATPPGIQRRP